MPAGEEEKRRIPVECGEPTQYAVTMEGAAPRRVAPRVEKAQKPHLLVSIFFLFFLFFLLMFFFFIPSIYLSSSKKTT